MPYLVKVYQNSPYKYIDSFTIPNTSYMGALVDAANIVREKYSDARVGEIIKID
jgi:hypothetical protein